MAKESTEEIIRQEPLTSIVAALLNEYWEMHPEDPVDGKHALEHWEYQIKCLDVEPWRGGKHAGDCTKVPMTCLRCLMEDRLSDARILIKALDEMGYKIVPK